MRLRGDGRITLREHIEALLEQKDIRDQQRFDAQGQALTAALLAQQTAVTAAMAAAEKAVTKAEVATERRFECVASDVLILCADLVWRPAGDLLPGDELLAFDEESSDRVGRRFRKAVVTANSLARDALLLVTTPLGSVRCNYEHPWLVRRGKSANWQWVKTEELRPGDTVMHAVDTWEVDRSWESGWLAGMYDGEGCLCLNKNGGVQLSLTQRDSETSERAARALKERVSSMGAYRVEAGKLRHTQPFWHFIVSTRADVLKLLGSVRPPRLLVNADGVWEGKPLGGRHRTTVITSIEGAGSGMIARLSTSTRTYIGAGFAMHNSVNEFRQTLSDQTANFLPRTEYGSAHQALVDKINDLATRMDKTEGRSSGFGASWAILVAAVTIAIGLYAAFHR